MKPTSFFEMASIRVLNTAAAHFMPAFIGKGFFSVQPPCFHGLIISTNIGLGQLLNFIVFPVATLGVIGGNAGPGGIAFIKDPIRRQFSGTSTVNYVSF